MSQDVEKFQKENGVAFDPEENSAISSTSDRLIQKGNSTKKPVNFFSLSLFFLLGIAPWLTTNGIWMQVSHKSFILLFFYRIFLNSFQFLCSIFQKKNPLRLTSLFHFKYQIFLL